VERIVKQVYLGLVKGGIYLVHGLRKHLLLTTSRKNVYKYKGLRDNRV